MFGSKSKVQLPPRPQPPVPEQMVEDLENDTTDVVFQFVNEGNFQQLGFFLLKLNTKRCIILLYCSKIRRNC